MKLKIYHLNNNINLKSEKMFKNKNIILAVITLLISVVGIGQGSSPVITIAIPSASPTNYLEILMITVAALLVVVIWVLSNVLFMISKKAVEVTKAGKKVFMIGWIVMGSLFTNLASAQANITDSVTKVNAVNYYGGLSETSFWIVSTVLGLELLVVFALVLFIRGLWNVIHPVEEQVQIDKQFKKSWLVSTWDNLDKKVFTKAAPLEKEADMLLDHDYDGIKELDNALPPWWKYGFIITIFIAVLYLLEYEVWHNGPNPTEEYNAEMISARGQVDAYLASMKNNVDEKTVTMSDAAGIVSGAVIFSKTCVPCHGKKGEGGVGPNLTDDYYLHGGAVADLFKTIKYGYPDKGMQSWQSTYSPIQMQELASYIKTLKGTNPPNGKAPQGDFYKDLVVADSTNAAPQKDSVVVAK
jgi:cytochrome c oxidase cbb3-type subunit 3